MGTLASFDTQDKSPVARQTLARAALVFVVIVLIEAIGMRWANHAPFAPFEHGDASDYHRLALNLAEHQTFSQSSYAPYDPSMFRPVGYPLVVAAVIRLTGDAEMWVPVLQFALLAATA